MDYGELMQKQSHNDDLKSSSYEKCRKKTWWSPFYFKVVSFSLATLLKQGKTTDVFQRSYFIEHL